VGAWLLPRSKPNGVFIKFIYEQNRVFSARAGKAAHFNFAFVAPAEGIVTTFFVAWIPHTRKSPDFGLPSPPIVHNS